MFEFTVKRLLYSIPALLLVLIIIFGLVRFIPGDPAVALLGAGATNSQIEFLREQLDLNEPVSNQFLSYVSGLFQGDLGDSLRTKKPVMQELLSRLPATIELSIFAALLAIIIGIPIGIISSLFPNSLFDQLTRIFSLIGVSTPAFWLALILQIIFSLNLGWFPISGRVDVYSGASSTGGFLILGNLFAGNFSVAWNAFQHVILPASVLAAFYGATIARFLRSNMLEVINSDYIRTANGKGLHKFSIIFRHEIRNAILPVITVMGLKFAELLSGSILTETVFSWPGIGRFMFEAISVRDYPVVQGATLLFAVVYMVSSFLVDLLYGTLDPRIRVN